MTTTRWSSKVQWINRMCPVNKKVIVLTELELKAPTFWVNKKEIKVIRKKITFFFALYFTLSFIITNLVL